MSDETLRFRQLLPVHGDPGALVFAIVPILPALFSLITLVSWGLVMLGALFGLTVNPARRQMMLRFVWGQRYSLLILCALGWGSCQGMRAAARWWWMPRVEPTLAQSGVDWPVFRGNPGRTGEVGDESVVLATKRLWTSGYNSAFYASPTVVGNRVYCVGSAGDEGFLQCWDRGTGDLQWLFRPVGMRATYSSVVVVGNRLLCGEGLHRTERSRVFCLQNQDQGPPITKWMLETDSHVECTPVVVGDRVYVGAGDDGVFALQLDSRVAPQADVLWHVPGNQLPDVETALLADEQRVYVGCGTGGECLAILDAATGTELHRIPCDMPVHAPPALLDGRLYVGMGQGDLVQPEAATQGRLCCVEVLSGKILWQHEFPAAVLAAVVVIRAEVLCATTDGLVHVFSDTGRLKWEWDSGTPIVASLAVTNGHICGVNTAGHLFVLDRDTRQLVNETSLGSGGRFLSSPAIARKRIYVGTETHGLQCLGQPGVGR